MTLAVLASMKVRNLKANHSDLSATNKFTLAVLASMKVRNLKANHSPDQVNIQRWRAVLASMKVRNLKANHSYCRSLRAYDLSCISKYEGTKSES